MPAKDKGPAGREAILYRNMVKALPFPIVVTNMQGKILSHNPAFDRLFGETIMHAGKNLGEYLADNSLSLFLDAMAGLVKKETTEFRIDINALDARKELQYLTLQAQAWAMMPGKENILCTFQNLSEYLDENRKLRSEKELAEQATRSKSAFLANMSHEIRTPIHTVTGMTELILDTRLDDEQKEYVQQIRFAAEALLGLINDILDFSKIEAGKLHIEAIEFDLESMVENAIDMQSLEAFRRGLEVILMMPPDLPTRVSGDPVRIRQIITNLLSNAIKFTRHGHIILQIQLLEQSGDSARLRFEVRDTGIGIPAEKKALLFQAFSQVDASMTRKFGGTGLGLSICQSLVLLMKGEIGVESEAGKGAVFWFTLPFHLAPDLAAHPHDAPLENRQILVVDDDPESRQAIGSILQQAGITVVEAANGAEALARLRHGTGAVAGQPGGIDLVLIDMEMPGMDGWQLASEINADKTINQARLVLMNPPGKLAGEAKMKLLNWFDGYVAKPIKRRELLGLLTRLLDEALDLPAVDMELEELPVPDPAGDAPRQLQPGDLAEAPARGYCILVAEDHFVNQKLFIAILKSLGHTSQAASNGLECIQKVQECKPDLVFMDVQMPEMNGYDATQLLRSSGYSRPIIAVTANALKGDLDKCLQAGMNDYLSKPFQKKDVQAMLEKWLQRPETSGTTGQPAAQEPLYNPEFARKMFMDDMDLLVSVLKEFIERTPGIIAACRKAAQERDLTLSANQAHAIKGSSLSLGVNALGAMAARIEDLLRSPAAGQGSQLDALLAALEETWKSTREILEDFVNSGPV